LVTSEVTHQEIKNNQGAMRRPVERTFRLLNKVPIAQWDELMAINSQVDRNTVINTPMIRNDPLYQALLQLGLTTVDAQHVFVAANRIHCIAGP
jgi:hypothetical protein